MLTRKASPDVPARRFTDDAGEFDTVIGPGAQVKGEIGGKTNVELKGRLEGPCRIEGLFWQRPEATFKGELQATNAVLEGRFEGTAVVAQKIELRSSSKVFGAIRAKSLALAEGCYFEGRVDMVKEGEETAPPTIFHEARGAASAAEEEAPLEAERKRRPARKKKASTAAKEKAPAES